jgi:hypothetical protein
MDACVSHNAQNAISGQERPHSTSFRVARDAPGAAQSALGGSSSVTCWCEGDLAKTIGWAQPYGFRVLQPRGRDRNDLRIEAADRMRIPRRLRLAEEAPGRLATGDRRGRR